MKRLKNINALVISAMIMAWSRACHIIRIIRDNAEIIEETFNSGTKAYGIRVSY
jgi:hypothetical protein